MSCTIKQLEKGQVEVSCEIGHDDIKNELEVAARQLTEQKPIQGFRPGKAPFDVVVNRFGAMAVYESALPAIIRKHYVNAVVDAKVHVYGEPSINVTMLAPGNPVKFTATVAVVPKVMTLYDFRKIKVTPKALKIDDKQIEDAIKELQKMQTKEVRVEREAKSGDKILVDMDMSIAGVPMEGGQARNHGIYLDEDYYVPGLKDKVLGMKAEDKREFMLPFPAEHYQKNLAGKDVSFAVTVKEVQELQHPPIDDALAKTVGQESIASLKELVKKNMLAEATEKEKQRQEVEILDTMVEKSKFEEVPEKILHDEVERMIDELKAGLVERKVKFEDYLLNIKKTLDELRLEFSSQAAKRIKTAVLIRDVGEHEKVEVSDSDVLVEVQNVINRTANDPEQQARVRSEEYQDFVRSSMRNREVLKKMREAAVK